MIAWICTICYYEHKGNEAPLSCPECSSGNGVFVKQPSGAKEAGDEFIGLPQTVEEVRDRARKRLKGICAVYPQCDGKHDRICQREAYGKPIGMGGAGSGMSFSNNVTALENIKLKMRLVEEHFSPDASFDFFGLKLAMPIMGASTSGVGRYNNDVNETDFCRAAIRGCREAGSISWRGDTHFYTLDSNPCLEALSKERGYGVPIFKPRAQDVLKKLIERSEGLGCPAVGTDLDGCGSTIMAKHGQPVFKKRAKDIKELVGFTRLPFIAKGIMTPEDAEMCAEAGAKVVVVSNHGGRVLDNTPGTAEVLPKIAERLGKRVMLIADGGVRTGYDVLKMLALGADAVLLGRDIVRAGIGGGSIGVKLHMQYTFSILQRAMVMTGCPDLKSINGDILER